MVALLQTQQECYILPSLKIKVIYAHGKSISTEAVLKGVKWTFFLSTIIFIISSFPVLLPRSHNS